MSRSKLDCPHCINSSGIVPFTERTRGNQTCYLCKGFGYITKEQHKAYCDKHGVKSL